MAVSRGRTESIRWPEPVREPSSGDLAPDDKLAPRSNETALAIRRALALGVGATRRPERELVDPPAPAEEISGE